MDQRWKEIERLFLVAVQRKKTARPAFRAEARAGDKVLRRELDLQSAQDGQDAGRHGSLPHLALHVWCPLELLNGL